MEKLETKFTTIGKYYTEHFDDLRAFVVSRIKETEYADDIVQNVFIKLLSIDRIVTEESLSNLVYTIARNLIYDYYRHKKYVDDYSYYVVSKTGKDSFNECSSYSFEEIIEVLDCGIQKLNENQRKIYRMNVYDDLAVSEISKTLKMNYKSVENKLGSARKVIRKYMSKMLA
ncbi:RNA polymerase sigma factor [uncultured Prevotella sp.]|uniref:RNA polymerase sigma factor n=1 Tax=uncultured Prevotella sp. TaxID=159272 RepID=UPI002615DBA0|nr:RNA polymerase sigma factor [uncultured Prevotella sp.]